MECRTIKHTGSKHKVANIKWETPDTNSTTGHGAKLHWDLVSIIANRRRLNALRRDVFNNRDGPDQEALRQHILHEITRETTQDWDLNTEGGSWVAGGHLSALERQLEQAIRRDRALRWRQKVNKWFTGDQSKLYSWIKTNAVEPEAGGLVNSAQGNTVGSNHTV